MISTIKRAIDMSVSVMEIAIATKTVRERISTATVAVVALHPAHHKSSVSAIAISAMRDSRISGDTISTLLLQLILLLPSLKTI